MVVAYTVALVVLVVRSFRSGIYLEGDVVIVRKVFSTYRFQRSQIRRFYVSDSWVLRGAQCVAVETVNGRRVKCPSAPCAAFDFSKHNSLVGVGGSAS